MRAEAFDSHHAGLVREAVGFHVPNHVNHVAAVTALAVADAGTTDGQGAAEVGRGASAGVQQARKGRREGRSGLAAARLSLPLPKGSCSHHWMELTRGRRRS